jgi:hypothetical protein
VEVETSRNARPEVQATTIGLSLTRGLVGVNGIKNGEWDHERRIGPVI